MEDLVHYSAEVEDDLSTLATHDIMIHFIKQLMEDGRNLQALDIARKVVEARTKKLGRLNSNTLEAWHLLPSLLNST